MSCTSVIRMAECAFLVVIPEGADGTFRVPRRIVDNYHIIYITNCLTTCNASVILSTDCRILCLLAIKFNLRVRVEADLFVRRAAKQE